MGCWFVVGVLVVLEALGLVWPGPRSRSGGQHRSDCESGRTGRVMRSWPGPCRDDPPGG